MKLPSGLGKEAYLVQASEMPVEMALPSKRQQCSGEGGPVGNGGTLNAVGSSLVIEMQLQVGRSDARPGTPISTLCDLWNVT